jgi:AcrR family transcriptional regulator
VGAVNIPGYALPVTTKTKGAYHHGNLRAALLEAGLELAREGGPDAVVLREASRRVGVSHNAGYRHFPDREALLAEVGIECMRRLALLMEQLIGEVDPGDRSVAAARARLRACGAAYTRFALTEPGLFRTAFCLSGLHAAGPPAALASSGTGDSGLGPFELLQGQLDELLEAGGMAPERRPYAEYAAWSLVHGFSTLMLDPLREMPVAERDAALERLQDVFEAGLAS